MINENLFLVKPQKRWPEGCLDCAMGGQICCFYGNGTQRCNFAKDCPTAPKPISGKLLSSGITKVIKNMYNKQLLFQALQCSRFGKKIFVLQCS